MKNLLLLLFTTVLVSCQSDKSRCLERSTPFSPEEISGIWKGKDDLYNFNQYEIKLYLNSDRTYRVEEFLNDDPSNYDLNQEGTYFTSVEPMNNVPGLFEHYLHLKWNSKWGVRESKYKISYVINPTLGEQRSTGKTDTYSKGFYLYPVVTFVTSGSTDSGIILKGDMN
jgi:hypothetical protein